MAGAEGFEPPKAVLETAGLPLAYAPGSQITFQTNPAFTSLLGFPMRLVLAAVRTELFHFQTFGSGPLVLCFAVVPVLAFAALELNDLSWHSPASLLLLLAHRTTPQREARSGLRNYSTIPDTVPAPTVRPPSRIAKRNPLSMATGVINSTSICTLSPGITISMPSGSFATPVTSVVRK